MPHAGDLWLAIARNDLNRVQELIKFDPNFVRYRNPNANGRTPLHTAAAHGNPEIVLILLCNGVDIEAQDDKNGKTPLHLAAEHGQVEAVEVLLHHGADVTARDIKGKTPLFASTDIYNRRGEETQALLLASGADKVMDVFDAVRLGNIAYVTEALNVDPALISTKDMGYREFTLLHHAAETGQIKVAEYLLSLGADPNANDIWGGRRQAWQRKIMNSNPPK